ncbi:hypothetical protein WCN91_00545 [Pseudoalteromonas sp. YIC-827]|uniref:Zinc ribbon domain-containing protein n=1 Tax=Pseudoalteromonas qingdaonensis TaxID=3131913 RepID=A0ABU9MUF6_9GAMM
MTIICPKCNYERKDTDINPEWECPSCGVAYAKVQQKQTSLAKEPSNTKSSRIDKIIKNKLFVVGFICLTVGYFAGREHLKYQVRSSMEGVLSSFSESLSPKKEQSFIEEKISDFKSALKPKFVSPIISNKSYKKYKYDEAITFDVTWDTSELDKPTRAIKGILIFSDLFGESQFRIRTTINNPLSPKTFFTETGIGFDYNQFKDSHNWMLVTDVKDMKVTFDVQNVIYADGTSESFE